MPALEVSELVVRYGSTTAVDGVSFAAEPGEVVALLGPNGAGKTTTVETLEGYRRPSSGSVRVLGLDPIGDKQRVTPRIGVMLQKGGVYPGMAAADVLRLFAAYYEDPADPDTVLAEVGLQDVARTPWRRLSGGEQQRLSLGLAVIGRPEVAFLDEPTAGIDAHGKAVIRERVRRLRDAGACVLLTTHDLEDAERLADRVVIIDHGRVVAEGTPAALTAGQPVEEIRFRSEAGLDVASLGATLGGTVVEAASGEYVAAVAPTPDNVAAVTGWLAARGVALGDLRAGRQTLEDLFLRLTGGGER